MTAGSAAIDLEATAHEHAARLRAGDYTARQLAEATLARVRAQDSALNAYITLTDELALQQADAADARIRGGDAGPLTGIPIAIKDLISTKGVRTTAGSKMLETFTPVVDATVVQRLQAAGAVTIGKANLDEFAMGSSSEHSAYGVTRNPWALDRVPGGSSGGSAATVAARGVPLSLGTDTGGSIREPAAFCGILGVKPTYGRVSRWGVVAFGSSLEQVGPFARDAEDAADLLQALAGRDPLDATTVDVPVPDYRAQFGRGVEGLRVGVPTEFEGLDEQTLSVVERAVDVLRQQGAIIDYDVHLPAARSALPVYYIIAPSEASANLARYDGVKYGFSVTDGQSVEEEMSETRGRGFGPEVKRRIMLGTYALSAGYYDAYYLKAQRVRTLIRREFEAAFADHDVLLTATSPTPAFRIGEKMQDPYEMYLNDLYTIPVNIAGNPALSMPCGFVNDLPIGLQLIGKPFDEATILGVAHTYEQQTDWHLRRPTDLDEVNGPPA